MRFGLFPKFVSVMVSLALVPVLFFAYRAIHVSEVNIENSILELQTKMAEKLAAQVDSFFKFYDYQMAFLFSSLQKNLTWEDKSELVRTAMATNPDVQEISFVSPDGREVLHFPEVAAGAAPVSRAEDPGFKRYLTTRKHTLWLGDNPPSLDIYFPLANNMAGRVHVSLSNLAASLETENIGGTGFVVMVNGAGEPLFLPEGRLDDAARTEMPSWALVQNALKSPSVVSEAITQRDLVGAAQSLSNVGGAILILQARSEAYAGVAEMKKSTMLTLVVVALVAVVGAGFLAKRLAAPLLVLSKAAETVAQGRFDTQVSITTRDEVRDLADTFNKMTAQLKAYAEMQVQRILLAQHKTEAILFSISDGILMTDVQDTIQLANRRSRELIGVPLDADLTGKTVTDALPASKLRDAIVRGPAAVKGKGFADVDLSTAVQRQWLRVTQQPVFSPKTKEVLGLVTGLHDATAEKELERMKDEFLHNITADMSGPLALASQHAQALLQGAGGPVTDVQRRSLAFMNQALVLQVIAMGNAFDMANIEAGRLAPQPAPARLSEVASRVVAILAPLAAERALALSVVGGGEAPIAFDAALIERVLTNLIVNAIKFTPAGSVTVAVTDGGTSQEVTVTDTGIGVPAGSVQRIFKKFERAAGAQGGGVGLGLTVAKAFIEAHRGKIWAEAVAQGGSRFSFTLPKSSPAGAQQDAAPK
ncbi:MAG: HAMP domain-containing protein [Elusimicrobia bacterium]|nr:HAMP domain-containing protein [Elusimicrobiota bacterium]